MKTALVSRVIMAVLCMLAGAEAAPPDLSPQPDAEFLEFLGSWPTEDNRWTDPFQVDKVPHVERGGQPPDRRVRDAGTRNVPGRPPDDGSRGSKHDAADPQRDMTP